ncbi:hypothetical protein C0J52_07663 [Blattella germanica]|nr:hypothetical protein C0J52_07663 [Blattella germanica]
MTETEAAYLLVSEKQKSHCDYSRIVINKDEFIIGRARTASFNITSLLVSKIQCIFQKKDQDWTICDKSSFGTIVNGIQLEKDVPTIILDNSQVEFGVTGKFKFTFHTKDVPSVSSPPTKRLKMEKDDDSERTQPYYDSQKQKLESKYQKRVEELEEKHSQEMQALQSRLQSENSEQDVMNKKKQELEEQHTRERIASEEKLLEKALQEQKDQQVKSMLEQLKKEVAEREEVVRIQLAKEIQDLQDEKIKLEHNIRGELSKKEGESAENLKHLQEELQKVKKDLFNVEGKKQYLEKELAETTKAKEDASESCLKAKQEVLQNFGDLMETELQCSICNELFVTATTLNCTHTFCKFCILEWKKKKKDCPVCRTKISSENRSIVLDNFIDRMVSNLSEELRNRRQEIVEERQVQELLGQKQKPETTPRTRRRNRRVENEISSTSSSEALRQNSNEVIVISSDSEDENFSNSSMMSYEEELDEEEEDGYMEGIPGTYYGGYGHCYRCGRRGHWSRGCPY